MVQDISPDELESMIDDDPALFILDVREKKELAMIGAIPNIVNVPMGTVPRHPELLPHDRSQKIVVVCQSGSRSYSVAQYLESKGYQNVYNLDSGTMGWIISGKKVVRGSAPSE